jgi:hypothetical protein
VPATATAAGPSIGPERPPLKRGGADEEEEEETNGKELVSEGASPQKKRWALSAGDLRAS